MVTKRKRIKENTKPNNIQEKVKIEDINTGIIIDFSYPFSLYSCNVGSKYTNYLKSCSQYFDLKRKLFDEGLSYFASTTIDRLAMDSKSTHTHHIRDKEQIDLIQRVLKELVYKQNSLLSEENIELRIRNYIGISDIWQLGYKNGLRLIGTRRDNTNIFNLLFIDYHHLVDPSVKYNHLDYKNYKFCPMTSVEISEDYVASDKVQ